MRHASARHVLECAGARHAPVVQWIEWRIPVPQIRVRFPTGVLSFASVVISLVLKCRFPCRKEPLYSWQSASFFIQSASFLVAQCVVYKHKVKTFRGDVSHERKIASMATCTVSSVAVSCVFFVVCRACSMPVDCLVGLAQVSLRGSHY